MIYLLEDDDSIRKLVLYGLDSQGFQSKGFALPSEFWRAMDTELPELVLLDIMLPEEDGLSILKKLRNTPFSRPAPLWCRNAHSFLCINIHFHLYTQATFSPPCAKQTILNGGYLNLFRTF